MATVKDIAAAAGVSKAAVSKVLHNSSSSVRVSPERADLIKQIAAQMGYVPNANARILRSSKTQTIGLYFDDLAGIGAGPLYTTCLLDGVCQVIFRRHYRVALVAELDEVDAVRSLADGRMDGVIWCRMVRDARSLDVMKRSPIPVVVLGVPNAVELSSVHFVYCDNEQGIESAVDHLWDLGHRRILFLREAREESASDCEDRLQGFRTAMARRGRPVAEEDVASWSWDLDEFADWWAARPPHTAVIGWSERVAGRLLERCEELSIPVPGALSVVGFDSTRYCDATNPPLTAVRQPITEMASYATRTLLDLIDGKDVDPDHPQLPCPLDIRRSTGVPRTSSQS